MTRVLRPLALALACVALSGGAAKAVILIDFDAVPTFDAVNEFYNGGTSSSGAMGPNLGVSFGPTDDWLTVTGLGETSPPNLAYSNSGAGVVNVAAGFTSVDFTYGAFTDSLVSVYSGLDGTGALLGSVLLPANDPNLPFDPASVPFAGTGKSIVISSGFAQFGWDDLTLGEAPTGVPAPAGLVLALTGIGALVGRRRLAK
ncbi:MAG: hypothetical protein K2X87_05835 [Gemmataceae bacterium]|nr:hypothetical protein [Gemmataceae bacterium]